MIDYADGKFIDVPKLARTFCMNTSGMAKVLGVHRNTMTDSHAYKVQESAREVIRLLSIFRSVFGASDAEFYFANLPLPAIGHFSALDAMSRGVSPDDIALAVADFA